MAFIISGFYFFYFALIGVHIIFIPKILDSINYDSTQIGIIYSAAPLVRFIVPFLFLRGFRLNQNIFFAALVLMAISSIGFYLWLYNFYMLLLANIAFGIGLALILPFVEVISLDFIGKERYGKIRLFGSIGFIAVALVLGRFLSSPEIGIGFLVAMAFATLVFGASVGVRDKKSPQKSDNSSMKLSQIFGDYRLWLGFLLMQVSFGPFYNFFTIYATDHNISLNTTVWLWSFGVIAEIVMFYYQGKWITKNLQNVLYLTASITAFRWILVAFFIDYQVVLFFSQSLHAFSFALFHTAAIAMLFSIYSAKGHAQQFYLGIAYGLGGFIGAISSGYIYKYFPQQLFIFGSVVALVAAMMFRLHRAK